MRPSDMLRFDLQVLNRHRFRTLMLLFAMSIGVAAVNVLTGLGEGAKQFVLGEFSMLGKNTLIMMPGKKETRGGMPPITGESPREITLADADALTRLPGVIRVAPLIVGVTQVSFDGLNREVTVSGTSRTFFDIQQLAIRQGKSLPDLPSDMATPVAVLGSKLKAEIFGQKPALGMWLKAGGYRFRVIGIAEAKGQALGVDLNDVMIIPVASAQALFNQEGLFRVMIEAQSEEILPATQARLEKLMQQRHEGEEDVTVITQDSVLSAFNDILNTLTLAVAGIGAISLLVAGVLIMNVTLISVTQRTQEIGLLKAIGASDHDVLTLFLTESCLLASMGAFLGLIISQSLLFIGRTLFPDLGFQTPLWAMLLSVTVALLTALMFAWRPAKRASAMEPISALQSKN